MGLDEAAEGVLVAAARGLEQLALLRRGSILSGCGAHPLAE